jgi:3D-(3,5/4)-trihydroxycyclohexane-1,2-dione acylhydrolase (decyclizing)
MEAFTSKRGIPVCESQAGKGSVAEVLADGGDNYLALGGLGVTGTEPANVIVEEADLVVSWGCRLGDFVTNSNSILNPGKANAASKNKKIVNVNLNAIDAGKLGAATSVVGDVLEVLRALDGGESNSSNGNNLVSDFTSPSLLSPTWKTSEEYQDEIKARKAQWLAKHIQICSMKNSDSMVVNAVNSVCNKIKGVQVAAAGGLPGELHKLWRSNGMDDYHLEYGYSCMGYEVAGGLGVKMAVRKVNIHAWANAVGWQAELA